MTVATAEPTLAQAIWTTENRLARNLALAVLGTVALWISAKIQVPFHPVPMTMQVFVVLTIGMAFGWRLGTATMLLYLAEGAAGLPVFAGTPERGIGLAYMAGPTGGYLVGYVLAAAIVGGLAAKGWDRRALTTLAAMVVGTAVIYACGVIWLGATLGWDKPLLKWGVTPFLPAEAFKIALATALLPFAWRLAGKR